LVETSKAADHSERRDGMKSHVVILLALILFAGIVGVSQTTSDLQKKYGPPDSEGRYIVRPGIGLIATVDDAGTMRDITIGPISSNPKSAAQPAEKPTVMKAEVAETILSEVLPVSKRGRYKGTGNAEFGCTSVDHMEYEKVVISIRNRCAEQGGGTYSMNIHWKG